MIYFKRRWFIYTLIILTFFTLSGMGIKRFILDETEPIYKVQKFDVKTVGGRPVYGLISNIKNKRWHLLRESFATQELYDEFLEEFEVKLADNDLGVLGKAPLAFKIASFIPQSKAEFADCIIAVTISHKANANNLITLECESVYDEISNQYFIKHIDYSGGIVLNTTTETPEIPQISESPCVVDDGAGFMYVRPKWRLDKSSSVQPYQVLGSSPNQEREQIPADYYNTDAITQAPFDVFRYTYENPKWTACHEVSPAAICDELFERNLTFTYEPGNMLTQQDVIDAGLTGWLFASIKDSKGVIEVSSGNNLVSYPTGFFVDNGYKRLTALTANNETIHYGGGENQHKFVQPEALAVAGDFLYVLDRGTANHLVVFRYGLTNGKLNIEFIGTTDLNQSFEWITDISGYRGVDYNVLYGYDTHSESFYRFEMDAETGFLRQNSQPKEFKHFVSEGGSITDFGGIERFEVSPRSNGQDLIFSIYKYNKILSVTADENVVDSKMHLNFLYEMPVKSVPANIGYNIGNNTFLLTDLYESKVHIFSGSGAYLGSGGHKGFGDTNSELFRPFIVSSNNFANDAIEFVVSSYEWDLSKGFKRFFPQADLGKIEVLEKTATDFSNIQNNELIFRYALTAGNSINSIQLKLNGQVIKTLTSPFFPDVNAESFLTSGSGENGLSEELIIGWNTYEIELTANIPGPSNASLQYKKQRQMQFYYMPSVFNGSNVEISDREGATYVHNKTDNPFYIYKNMLIEGAGEFLLKNGKTIIMEGCTLKIAKERAMAATNEEFELKCGANIEVNTTTDIPKLFQDDYFNGTFTNHNVISCRGDYTGGQGSGSAPSSVLEIINCKFNNYVGKALHVMEGRASVVNSVFENTIGNAATGEILTSAAIAVDPKARLDVRGGQFLMNDIAIDGNGAELFIGRHVDTYKGVKFNSALFQENKIALHAFSCYTEIQNSNFQGNHVAVIDLNGTLDISKNSDNTFDSNGQALIFSNLAGGQSGNNKFLNNEVDISYLVPIGTTSPVTFDFTCNYWKHDNESGTPIIDVISDPVYDQASQLVSFSAIPYLELKNNSYTCTGGKGGRISAPTEIEDLRNKEPLLYHKSYLKIVTSLAEANDNYTHLKKGIEQYPRQLLVGQYLDRYNIPNAFQQSLLKNGLFTYLYRGYKPWLAMDIGGYTHAFKYLSESISANQDHYINITLDRLDFVSLFRHDKYSVVPPTETQDRGRGIDAVIYPNPTKGESVINFSVPMDGLYSLDIYTVDGLKIKSVIEKKDIKKGVRQTLSISFDNLPSGLYLVKLYKLNDSSFKILKVIKK
jgi:hypothetical protein